MQESISSNNDKSLARFEILIINMEVARRLLFGSLRHNYSYLALFGGFLQGFLLLPLFPALAGRRQSRGQASTTLVFLLIEHGVSAAQQLQGLFLRAERQFHPLLDRSVSLYRIVRFVLRTILIAEATFG